MNSSGFLMSSEVIRMRTDEVIETASSRSSMKAGIGRISRITMPMTPSARATSPFSSHPTISRGVGRFEEGRVASVI